MSQAQAAMDSVPLSSQPLISSKYESQVRTKTALIIMISVLATSAIFLGVILGVMHRHQPTIQQASEVLTTVEQIMDYPNRLLHGNLFHVTTNLLQSNWYEISKNVTTLSQKISQIFNSFDIGDDGEYIARYAALTTSVAAKFGWIKPNWQPSPIPRPSDDEGIINVLFYISEWASSQTNSRDIRDLASSCDALASSILSIDWSGQYQWGKGRGYGSWDVNNLKGSVQRVQEYCQYFAKLQADESAAPSDGMHDGIDISTPTN